MPTVHEGNLLGTGKRFGIVVGRFNEFITRKLLEGAQDAFLRHGVASEDLEIFWVPGSFEIPLVAMRAASSKKFAAVICLGTVIRGQTPHFDYVAGEAAKGVAQVGLKTGVPCIFGIVTAETIEQAIERAGTKAGNRGADAACSAIEMANLLEQIET